MKLPLMIFMIAILGLSTINVKAQTADVSRIKILSTERPGVLKLIHGIKTNENESVNVQFSNSSGVLMVDKITGNYPKGISRRYDISKIKSKDFILEINSPGMSARYRIEPSEDKKTFTASLERTVYNNALLASRN